MNECNASPQKKIVYSDYLYDWIVIFSILFNLLKNQCWHIVVFIDIKLNRAGERYVHVIVC